MNDNAKAELDKLIAAGAALAENLPCCCEDDFECGTCKKKWAWQWAIYETRKALQEG